MASDIERKFIDRKTSDEEEASLMQHATPGRWHFLLLKRERCDLARRWEDLENMMPGVVALVREKQDFATGLAFLIEEIHHLNETMAMDRRGR